MNNGQYMPYNNQSQQQQQQPPFSNNYQVNNIDLSHHGVRTKHVITRYLRPFGLNF